MYHHTNFPFDNEVKQKKNIKNINKSTHSVGRSIIPIRTDITLDHPKYRFSPKYADMRKCRPLCQASFSIL